MENKEVLNEANLEHVTGGAEDHNVMTSARFSPTVEAQGLCRYCGCLFPLSQMEDHEASCPMK